jgi:hypothetical protein
VFFLGFLDFCSEGDFTDWTFYKEPPILLNYYSLRTHLLRW